MNGDELAEFIRIGEILNLPMFHFYAVEYLLRNTGVTGANAENLRENLFTGENRSLTRPDSPEITDTRRKKGSPSKNTEGRPPKAVELLPWFLLHVSLQPENSQVRTELAHLEKEISSWYLPALEYQKSVFEKSRRKTVTPPPGLEMPAEIARNLNSILDVSIRNGVTGVLESEDAEASTLPIPRPPLVLTHDRKYVYILKQRQAEDRLIRLLEDRIRSRPARIWEALLEISCEKPDFESALTLLKQFAEGYGLMLLSGGPGTGKTTTVAQFICFIAEGCQKLNIPMPEIALCAPTGLAAKRLAESLNSLQSTLNPMPKSNTIHNLVGISRWEEPDYNPTNPLAAQLVIADEASMIDLGLMNSLLSALNPTATLLLVGDANQLPPVGIGAILGDILGGSTSPESPVRKGLTILEKVYRSDSSIVRASRKIAEGQFDAFISLVRDEEDNSVQLRSPGERPEEVALKIAQIYQEYCGVGTVRGGERMGAQVGIEAGAGGVTEVRNENKVGTHSIIALSPLRWGPWGITAMNRQITMALSRQNTHIQGIPIAITTNNRKLNLHNGDKAILREEGGQFQALFPDERNIPLHTIEGWETAWMQTIHKSQGSEYEMVVIVLPSEAQRLLSREILYTAFTRAKKRILLFSEPKTIKTALANRIQRNSRIRNWAAGEN